VRPTRKYPGLSDELKALSRELALEKLAVSLIGQQEIFKESTEASLGIAFVYFANPSYGR
jgi:hypothetical protein